MLGEDLAFEVGDGDPGAGLVVFADDEDLLDADLPFQPEEWNSPHNLIEPDAMYGVDDYY